MPTILRIILAVLCVVTLARSVTEQETGALGSADSQLAALGELGEARAIGAHG